MREFDDAVAYSVDCCLHTSRDIEHKQDIDGRLAHGGVDRQAESTHRDRRRGASAVPCGPVAVTAMVVVPTAASGAAAISTSIFDASSGTVRSVAATPFGSPSSASVTGPVKLSRAIRIPKRFLPAWSSATSGDTLIRKAAGGGKVRRTFTLVVTRTSRASGRAGHSALSVIRRGADGGVGTGRDRQLKFRVIRRDRDNAYVARLNANGTVDSTFAPQPNLQILCMALQPDGKVVIGGDFTLLVPANATSGTPSTYAYNYIARVNSDGSIDTTFNPDCSGPVYTLALLPNKQIVIGGSFSSLTPNGGKTTNYVQDLARLNSDGTVDTTFFPDPSAPVSSIAVQPDGKIIVAGTFTAFEQNANVGNLSPAPVAGPIVDRSYIARINTDGTVDTTFDPNPNGGLTFVALQANGQVVFGGNFTEISRTRPETWPTASRSPGSTPTGRLTPGSTRRSTAPSTPFCRCPTAPFSSAATLPPSRRAERS